MKPRMGRTCIWLNQITDTNLEEAIMRAEISAKGKIEELGMADLLKEHKKWDKLDSKAETMVNDDSDSEEDNDQCTAADKLTTSLVLEVSTEDSMDNAPDIKKPSLRLIVVYSVLN